MELKATTIYDAYWKATSNGDNSILVYLKSEADKVIAELKNEIEVQKRLRNMALASVPNVLKVMKIIQHHKYKRCLAMAEICRHEWCTMYYERKKYSENKFLDHLMSKKNRHKEKWLELAEKFKPNN